MVFLQIEGLVDIGHEDSCRDDEPCHELIELAVAHLEQDGDKFFHPIVEFLLRGHRREEVECLHTNGVHGMGGTADALVLEEVVEPAVVVGDQCIEAHVHLHQVKARGEFEECRDTHAQVVGGHIPVAVGHQFGQLLVQTDFVLQRDGHGCLWRKHEAYETRETRVLVDEMSQFVSDDEAQLILCHQVEESGVDIHDIRLALVFRSHRKGVHRRVASDIEVDGLFEMQFVFHLMAQSVEVGQRVLLDFQTVSLHTASPVGIGARGLDFLEHGLYHRPLEGVVDLLAELFLQGNGWFQVFPALFCFWLVLHYD